MQTDISIDTFRRLLPTLCDRETSQDAVNWSEHNPLWGHCAVVSLVAQNLFGGQLMRASLAEVPGFERMGSHYWNLLENGQIMDFTRAQFGGAPLDGLQSEVRERSYTLSFPATLKRYKLLAWRLAKAINAGNPLFNDEHYRLCFDAALESPCQKMKFGCVLVHDGDVVCVDKNRFIEPLASLCTPSCIRLSITSRTESMLGACGHAEEFVIWDAIHRGIPLHECDLYIAGMYPNGLPWIKKEAADHTCLRCTVQMHNANIRTVFVPHCDRWVGLSSEQAIAGAKKYATQEKKV